MGKRGERYATFDDLKSFLILFEKNFPRGRIPWNVADYGLQNQDRLVRSVANWLRGILELEELPPTPGVKRFASPEQEQVLVKVVKSITACDHISKSRLGYYVTNQHLIGDHFIGVLVKAMELRPYIDEFNEMFGWVEPELRLNFSLEEHEQGRAGVVKFSRPISGNKAIEYFRSLGIRTWGLRKCSEYLRAHRGLQVRDPIVLLGAQREIEGVLKVPVVTREGFLVRGGVRPLSSTFSSECGFLVESESQVIPLQFREDRREVVHSPWFK